MILLKFTRTVIRYFLKCYFQKFDTEIILKIAYGFVNTVFGQRNNETNIQRHTGRHILFVNSHVITVFKKQCYIIFQHLKTQDKLSWHYVLYVDYNFDRRLFTRSLC